MALSVSIAQLLILGMFVAALDLRVLGQSDLEITMMPPMKGMTLNAWSAEAYNSSDFDESIENLADINANWVTFTVFWFMSTPQSIEMNPRPDLYTASDSSLIHAIQKAKQLNTNAALKPMVDVEDGSWRGQINPINWTLWFQNYRIFIDHYADLAESYDVELFIVGTELRSSQPYESRWRQVISEVRVRYSGNITYAANWDSYGTGNVGFWDSLDYVGVDAYFPLTNSYNPTVQQLVSAWSSSTRSGFVGRNWINELYLVYNQTNKKIVFTEIGYYSQDGVNTQPWTGFSPSHSIDLQEQADCYQAALEALKSKAWFVGWFWWDWQTDPNAGGPSDNWYTPQGKPAQSILSQYYYEPSPDIAVTNVVSSRAVVGKGYSVTINTTMENQGISTATFNLTVFANTTVIQTQNISLQGGSSTTVTFLWNTIGVDMGNYTIWAYVDPLAGETDTADNTFADGTVLVTLPGDVNGDSKVDGRDLALIAKYFGSSNGYPPNADVNGDGKIDGRDIALAAKNFGQIWA